MQIEKWEGLETLGTNSSIKCIKFNTTIVGYNSPSDVLLQS